MLKGLLWMQKGRHLLAKVSAYLWSCANTFIAAVLAGILWGLSRWWGVEGFTGLQTFFIATGGMIGTIIALVFSLSVLPIQHAAESFGPSITKSYVEDKVTKFISVILGLLCLVSFALGAGHSMLTNRLMWVAIELVVIGMALDFVRWNLRHVSRLLQPHVAVKRLRNTAIKCIDRYGRIVRRLAERQLRLLDDQSITVHDVEMELWRSKASPNVIHQLFLNDIAEGASKAIGRGEVLTAKTSIYSIKVIACRYLELRRDNFSLFRTSEGLLGAWDSDISHVLNPVYEHLRRIFVVGATQKNEVNCADVLNALGDIAIKVANLTSSGRSDLTGALTYMPLGYLAELTKEAQRGGLDEVALKGSHELLRVCEQAPQEIPYTYVHVTAADCWFELAGHYLTQKDGVWGGIILRDVMQLLAWLREKDYRGLIPLLEQILSKLEGIVPWMILNEVQYGSGPFEPYSHTYEKSLSRLSVRIVHCIIAATENDRDRHLRVFVDLNKSIWKHLRSVTENVEFGGSFLLWHMNETIKEVALGSLQMLKRDDEVILQWRGKLLAQIGWILSPLEFVFHGSKNLQKAQVEKICDTFCWVGLEYYGSGFRKTGVDAVLRIASVVNMYCGFNVALSKFEIAELMMHIWYFRVFVESTSTDELTLEKLDSAMVKPSNLSDQMWGEVSGTLDLRKSQLREYLNKWDPFVLPTRSMDMLKLLLAKASREREGEDSVPPTDQEQPDESAC